jgi:hypothetical protein
MADARGDVMIPVGSKVYLKVCPYGEPGTVIRRERARLVVLWPDLDYIARHPEASLETAPELPLGGKQR